MTEQTQVDFELLANQIDALSTSVRQIFSTSKLNEKTIILLLSHHAGMSQRDTKNILDTLQDLHLLTLAKFKKK